MSFVHALSGRLRLRERCSEQFRKLFSSGSKPHVCYALSLDDDDLFAELASISAACVRRLYPFAKITVLTDEQTRARTDALRPLRKWVSEIKSVGGFEGSARLRSRFVKTQARTVIEGDFLYLDADTVAVLPFDELFQCAEPLAAAIDRNRVDPEGGFPRWVIPDFQRLGWAYPTKLYLNSGILFWKDCAESRTLGRLWHENWLHYTRMTDNPADQPAFNHSIDSLGIKPKIVDDVFNARVGISPKFARGARIYHLLSGDERANGTFMDQLRARYHASGRIDFDLVAAAVERGDPWLESAIDR